MNVERTVRVVRESLVQQMRAMKESLDARLTSVETNQRRGAVMGDLKDQKEEEVGEENTPQEPEEEKDVEEIRLEKLLKAVRSDGSKVKMELLVYSGSLNGEELLDQTGKMDGYFKFEEIPEKQQVKLARGEK